MCDFEINWDFDCNIRTLEQTTVKISTILINFGRLQARLQLLCKTVKKVFI